MKYRSYTNTRWMLNVAKMVVGCYRIDNASRQGMILREEKSCNYRIKFFQMTLRFSENQVLKLVK